VCFVFVVKYTVRASELRYRCAIAHSSQYLSALRGGVGV